VTTVATTAILCTVRGVFVRTLYFVLICQSVRVCLHQQSLTIIFHWFRELQTHAIKNLLLILKLVLMGKHQSLRIEQRKMSIFHGLLKQRKDLGRYTSQKMSK